jgi:lipopolysaccharide heptosyltransferase I
MKICLVKTSSMGDIIHTLPALTDAAQALKDFSVDWVVEENFAEIPRWHFAVDKVIPIALRRWRKKPCATETRHQWQNYRKLLQQTQYDAVIDAQGLLKSAIFATRLARGEKHGYDRKSIREPLASWFYDKKYAISYQQHAVERIRQLFAQALGYSLPTGLGDYALARHFSAQQESVPYVLLFHSTTRTEKHWPENYWHEFIGACVEKQIAVRLPWGTPQEHARAERLAAGYNGVQVLPKLTLSQLASQIAGAQAVISVDTGLAHLTAALDKPAITLYGATDPTLIGAYGQNQHYLQADSMQEIQPNQAFNEFLRLLNQR